jgi:uncharacterized OsmC-like protein
MEANAIWVKDRQIQMETKGHTFMADVCKEEKGEKCAPSAVDYLTASFAGCVAYFISKALQNREFVPTGLKVKVTGDFAEAPHRIGSFTVEVELPPGLPEPLLDAAKRAAEGCTIHHTLTHPPTIQFKYQ